MDKVSENGARRARGCLWEQVARTLTNDNLGESTVGTENGDVSTKRFTHKIWLIKKSVIPVICIQCEIAEDGFS